LGQSQELLPSLQVPQLDLRRCAGRLRARRGGEGGETLPVRAEDHADRFLKLARQTAFLLAVEVYDHDVTGKAGFLMFFKRCPELAVWADGVDNVAIITSQSICCFLKDLGCFFLKDLGCLQIDR